MRDELNVEVEAELDRCLTLIMERGIISGAQLDSLTDDLALGVRTPGMLLNDISPLLRLADRGGLPQDRCAAHQNVPQPAKRGFGPRRTDAAASAAVQAECAIAGNAGVSVIAEMEALLALAHEASGGTDNVEDDTEGHFGAELESALVGLTALGIASLPSLAGGLATPEGGGGFGEAGDEEGLLAGLNQASADGACVAAINCAQQLNGDLAPEGAWDEPASSEDGYDEDVSGGDRVVGSAGTLAVVLDLHYLQLAGSSFSLQTDWEVAALEAAIERRVGGGVSQRYACDSDPDQDSKHGEPARGLHRAGDGGWHEARLAGLVLVPV
jgi:hypothetical protein